MSAGRIKRAVFAAFAAGLMAVFAANMRSTVQVEIPFLVIMMLLGVIAAFWRASATERNVHVLQEGQITERFTRAIEQLGSPRPSAWAAGGNMRCGSTSIRSI